MNDIADNILPGPWMQTVANILPLPHRAAMPFTLGEAVAEHGLWAKHARADAWNLSINRDSLDLDIRQLAATVGPRLGSLLQPQLNQLHLVPARADIVDRAERFDSIWRQRESIIAAFRDLCEAAAQPHGTSWDLRKLADILASQLGPSAHGAWSALSEAATAPAGEPQEASLSRWLGKEASIADVSLANRLRVAEERIVANPPTGDVVVWLVYQRAMVSSWQIHAGPITFLHAAWTVPNARREDGQKFPERDELRIVLENALWTADLEEAISDRENRLVLARVSMGMRAVAGAVEEAKRKIEAILSIAVGAGGVSWQSTGASATIIDGRVTTSSTGLHLRHQRPPEDTYGIGATAGILEDVAEKLDVAMAERPLPEYLIEALLALREAGMTDHRDVSSYGARAVTPRIATALQDHAMELIASVALMKPSKLAAALQEREVDWQFQQRVLGGIMAPLDQPLESVDRANSRTLDRAISEYDGNSRVVSVHKAVELRDDLLNLPMTDLARTDLSAALRAATDPKYETALLQAHHREVKMVRARHRRVRNAINHGNPLPTTTLESIRGFAERTARAALGIALEAYASDTSIASMLTTEQVHRQKQRQELANGRNYLERNPPPGATNPARS